MTFKPDNQRSGRLPDKVRRWHQQIQGAVTAPSEGFRVGTPVSPLAARFKIQNCNIRAAPVREQTRPQLPACSLDSPPQRNIGRVSPQPKQRHSKVLISGSWVRCATLILRHLNCLPMRFEGENLALIGVDSLSYSYLPPPRSSTARRGN